jgi:hypothetical protein
MALDVYTPDWSIEYIGWYWRYVSHEKRLATSGYNSREAAIRNADTYPDSPSMLQHFSKKYKDFYPGGKGDLVRDMLVVLREVNEFLNSNNTKLHKAIQETIKKAEEYEKNKY